MDKNSLNGYTLIELMLGMLLTSILVIGSVAMFSNVGNAFYDLMLRQKSVFILDGEMARLFTAYKYKDMSSGTGADQSTLSSNDNYPTRIVPPTTGNKHKIYKSTYGNMVVSDGTTFEDQASENALFYYDPTGAAEDELNLVWIDQEKKSVGKLSWIQEDADTTNCYGGNCFLISLYLDYPFRYISSTDPVQSTMGKIETLVLRVVVGKR